MHEKWQPDSKYSLVPFAADVDKVLVIQNRGYGFVQDPSVARASLQVQMNSPDWVGRLESGIPGRVTKRDRPELKRIWHK